MLKARMLISMLLWTLSCNNSTVPDLPRQRGRSFGYFLQNNFLHSHPAMIPALPKRVSTRSARKSIRRFILSGLVLLVLPTADAIADIKNSASVNKNLSTGYSSLKLLLDDEQYLTAVRRTRLVITFSSISEGTTTLIDNIADSSEQALDELEQLAERKPAITFIEFDEYSIVMQTFESIRSDALKSFFFDDDFEKQLLVSQLNVLRVMSQLAHQLEQLETSTERKHWLRKFSRQYESYYQKVYKRFRLR